MPGNPLDLHAARPAELQARIAAERLGEPFLVYRDAADAQVIVGLGQGRERVTIGRSTRADVALHWDREVSRLHATIERIAGDWCWPTSGSRATARSSTASA